MKRKISLLNKWKNRKKAVQSKSENYLLPTDKLPLLSKGQQRLWFLQQLNVDNPFYHYADGYHFTGELNVDVLIKSFKVLVQRHEILRTTFNLKDGQVIQTIHENIDLNVHFIDLQSLKREQQEAKEIAIEKARMPFDLEKDSLTRILILQLADNEYSLVLSMHHIITDKWSMKIFRNELAHIYTRLLENEKVLLPPLELQFKDFAYWESQQKVNQSSLEYWKNKLSGNLTFLNLPIDHPRPIRQSYNGKYLETSFSSELSKNLQRIAKENNITLFVLMLTAFKTLLYKYTGQEDILIGTPISNRDKVAFEKLIGFFNDTVVLRTNMSKANSFFDLVEQVKTTTLEAFAHKNVPFEQIVQELKVERDMNINPIFQTMFLFHNVPPNPSFGDDLKIKHRPFDFGVAKFDLTLYISEKEGALFPIFEYATDLFEHSTIERMHKHYQTLLENIVQNPYQRINDLSILSNNERNQLLNEWNETTIALPAVSNIHSLIEANAQKTPHNIAVVFDNQKITYQELNQKATNVAKYLLKSKIDKNSLIGVYTDRSIEMIIAILGILKAGGGYVPLDPEYPIERIKFMIDDAKMPVILTQAHLVDDFYDTNTQIIAIENIKDVVNSVELPDVSEEEIAYVIYTSGSTGKPKGVVVSHKNLIHSTTARYHFYKKQPSAFLLLSSFAFDSSIVGLFWTLCHGGKLVLPKHRIEQDLEAMGNLIEKHQVSHTLLLPSLYNVILEHIAIAQLKSLRTVIVAGEACSAILSKKHYNLLGEDILLYNEYGPTEASVWCVAHQIEPHEKIIPIGKPIPNTTTYILNKELKLVSIGTIGELYIGGNGITQGYLNRPELTAERFIQNPFSNNSNDRLYRTGDLVKYRTDGTIDFLGRKDYQVKIRGYRIELEEIREVVKQSKDVQEAIVVVLKETANSQDKELDEVDELVEKLSRLSEVEQERILKSIENLDNNKLELMLTNISG